MSTDPTQKSLAASAGENIVQREFTDIWEEVVGVSSAVWNFIEPTVKSDVSTAIQAFSPEVLAIILSLASTDQTGEAKRAAAFSQIIAQAEAMGITLLTSVVNTLIELALQNLKATGQVPA